MRTPTFDRARLRTRWSAIGAAIAVSLGAGGFGLANAAIGSGEKPVTITIEPERILDTRVNLGLAGRFADATPRDLQVTGNVNVAPSGSKVVVPADATGVLVNVTVVLPTSGGFLSLRPSGAAGSPQTSTVNFFANDVVPNSATVDLPANGKIQIWVETASDSGTADVLVDIVGYTVDHTHDDRYYTETEVDTELAKKVDKATGTDTLLVDPAAFRPTSDTDSGFFHEVQGYLQGGNTATQGQCVATQVHLPDGATVTRFDANVQQSATNTMDLLLLKNPLGPTGTFEMAGATTTTAAGNAVLTDTTVLQPVIDNDGFTYLLALCRYNNDAALRLYDVKITFTHP